MRRQLSILGLTLLLLVLFDISVALALRLGEGRIPGFASVARFFEYGRSVPGKLDTWERSPGSPGNLFEVALMKEAIADSAAKFARETLGAGRVVRGYGMSFTNQMLQAAAEADPALRIDLHAGPGASPNFTYALFLDEVTSRRSGDVVVPGLLSSSLASLAALSNRTGPFELPAPVTYPVFRPDNSRGLRRIDPLVVGLAEERSARSDTAVCAAWQRQLSLDDMLYTRAAFAAPVLDVSPLARLVWRALAVSAIDRRKEAVLDGDFPVEEICGGSSGCSTPRQGPKARFQWRFSCSRTAPGILICGRCCRTRWTIRAYAILPLKTSPRRAIPAAMSRTDTSPRPSTRSLPRRYSHCCLKDRCGLRGVRELCGSLATPGCLAFPCDRVDPLFHGIDPAGQMHHLIQQFTTDFPGERRQIRVRIFKDGTETREISASDP